MRALVMLVLFGGCASASGLRIGPGPSPGEYVHCSDTCAENYVLCRTQDRSFTDCKHTRVLCDARCVQ